jgi:hypothetical protein
VVHFNAVEGEDLFSLAEEYNQDLPREKDKVLTLWQ